MSKKKTIDELADEIFNDEKEGERKKIFIPPSNKIEPRSRLELVSEVKTFKGGFGTYTVSDKIVEVTLDTSTSTLDKKTLADLVEEIVEVGGMLK